MSRLAKLWVVVGLLAGAAVGVPISQYSPVFGGFATIGQPWSQARQSLIGTHVLAFAAVGAVLGFLVTWLSTKQAAGVTADRYTDTQAPSVATDHLLAPGASLDAGELAAQQARRKRALRMLAGPLGVMVFVGLGVSAVGRPNFTCRLGSTCTEMGFCTGKGWSCVVGGNMDCAQSASCQSDGRCTAASRSELQGERLCQAVSDADCARSKSCKTDGDCLQWDGQCFTAEKRNERRSNENGRRDRMGIEIGGLLITAARGGNTTIDLASFFAAEQLEGYAVDATTQTIESLENGTIRFNERVIPAAVIRASFTSTNRTEGRRRAVCIQAAAAYDNDYRMWREVVAKACDKPATNDAIEAWKSVNAFAPK